MSKNYKPHYDPTDDNDNTNDENDLEQIDEDEENDNDNMNNNNDDDENNDSDNDSDNDDEDDDNEGEEDEDDEENNVYYPYTLQQYLLNFQTSSSSSTNLPETPDLNNIQERLRLRNLLFSWVCQNCTTTQPLRLRKPKSSISSSHAHPHQVNSTTTDDNNHHNNSTSLRSRSSSPSSYTETVHKEIEEESRIHHEIETYIIAIQNRLHNMTEYRNAKLIYQQQIVQWRTTRLAYEAQELQEIQEQQTNIPYNGSDIVTTESDVVSNIGATVIPSTISTTSHNHQTLNMNIKNTNNITHESSTIRLQMDIDTKQKNNTRSMLDNNVKVRIADPGPPPPPPDYTTILASLPPVPTTPPTVPLSILHRQSCSNCHTTYIQPSESANKLLHDAHLQGDGEAEDEDNVALQDAVAIMESGAKDMSESITSLTIKQETMDALLPYNVNMDILCNTLDMKQEDIEDYLSYTGLTKDIIHEILQGRTIPYSILSSSTPSNDGTAPKHISTLQEQIQIPDPINETFRNGFGGFSPTTAIIYDDRMLAHEEVKRPANRQKNSLQFSLPGVNLPTRMISPHPERPDRLRSIAQHLVAMGLFQRCKRLPAREITNEELKLVHSTALLNEVHALPQYIRDHHGEYVYDTGDTFANPYTYLAARLSCGSVVSVTEAVVKGFSDRGIALVRPPGHHAEPDSCMGFCLYNNIGVAAAVAKEKLGLKRILIVDWDVHHGNGTEKMFYDDPSVLFISLHRYDHGSFYPGTGKVDRVGSGAGEGYNINIPWNVGMVGDIEYATAFDEIIMPIAYAYDPQLVLVSCGFDAARGDPLGGCDITPNGYAYMTHRLLSLAQGKVVVVLEGGYNLQSISRGMEAVLRTLLGQSPPNLLAIPSRIHAPVQGVAAELSKEHGTTLHNLGSWATTTNTSSKNTVTTTTTSDNEEEQYLDELYSGQSRQDVLQDLSPHRSAMNTIAEVLMIQSKYWPSLQLKYRTYAALIEQQQLQEKLLKQQQQDDNDSMDDNEIVYTKQVIKPSDRSTLIELLRGNKVSNEEETSDSDNDNEQINVEDEELSMDEDNNNEDNDNNNDDNEEEEQEEEVINDIRHPYKKPRT